MSYKSWAEALKARRAQKPADTGSPVATKGLQGEPTTPAVPKAAPSKQA